METKQNFDELIAFRTYRDDKADLAAVARRWELDEAEIARRALRAGLDVLRNVVVPGTRKRSAKRDPPRT